MSFCILFFSSKDASLTKHSPTLSLIEFNFVFLLSKNVSKLTCLCYMFFFLFSRRTCWIRNFVRPTEIGATTPSSTLAVTTAEKEKPATTWERIVTEPLLTGEGSVAAVAAAAAAVPQSRKANDFSDFPNNVGEILTIVTIQPGETDVLNLQGGFILSKKPDQKRRYFWCADIKQSISQFQYEVGTDSVDCSGSTWKALRIDSFTFEC
jgi:hypothetical protein